MGTTKTLDYSDTQTEVSQIAKVLSHPARVAILQYLSKQEGCICNDIVDEIGLAQPTISQHLRELKDIGLIQGNVEGKAICYCIDTKRWLQLQNLIHGFFKTINLNCKCL